MEVSVIITTKYLISALPNTVAQNRDISSILGRHSVPLRAELGIFHANDRNAHFHGEGPQYEVDKGK